MRNNSCKLDWYYQYNIQEVNSTETLSKYTFTHKLCSVILRNLHQFWLTKTPKWSAMTNDRLLLATLLAEKWQKNGFVNVAYKSLSDLLQMVKWFKVSYMFLWDVLCHLILVPRFLLISAKVYRFLKNVLLLATPCRKGPMAKYWPLIYVRWLPLWKWYVYLLTFFSWNQQKGP